MDGTVIPLDDAPGAADALRRFGEAVAAVEDAFLAYVTGRHLQLAVQGVRRHGLPSPAAFSCDVGTSIYQATSEGTWVLEPGYRAAMAARMGGDDAAAIDPFVADVAGLVPQEAERQREFKRSYYVDPPSRLGAVAAAVEARAAAAGLRVNVVTSVDTVAQRGLVDVLPRGAAKHVALDYLRERLGLGWDDVVYAGDSGNDLRAFASGCRAIVVGNTRDAIKREAIAQAEARGERDRLYVAEAPYAAGVLEGYRHFGVLGS